MSGVLKPVVVIIPQKRSDAGCQLPLVVNGRTFDLSTPSHVIRLTDKSAKSAKQKPRLKESSNQIESTSHKEVERKRKLKISSCISQLAGLLPYKTTGKPSHSAVLEAVVDHIKDLQYENEQYSKKSATTKQDGPDALNLKYGRLKLENLLLQELLQLSRATRKTTPPIQEATPTQSFTEHAQRGPTHNWPVTSMLATPHFPNEFRRYHPYRQPGTFNSYSDQSRCYPGSRDSQVMSLDPYPPVWRPYCDNGGLLDNSHSNFNNSFLMDSLLDDI